MKFPDFWRWTAGDKTVIVELYLSQNKLDRLARGIERQTPNPRPIDTNLIDSFIAAKALCILLDSCDASISVPARVPTALDWNTQLASSALHMRCIIPYWFVFILHYDSHVKWLWIKYSQYSDIKWTERESIVKHRVRSNVKQKTKENAPGQTAAQVKSE